VFAAVRTRRRIARPVRDSQSKGGFDMPGKKAKWILALLLSFALVMAACGGGSGKNNQGTSGPQSDSGGKGGDSGSQQKITAKFYHDLPAMTDYLNEINPVVEKNDNVTYEIIPYSDTTSYQTTVRVGLSTKDAADIFKWWNGFRMKELADAGHLADMTKEWEAMVADGVDPGMAAPLTFDGKTYGIPGGVHYWVVYYNKKIFDEHQLKEPTTWEEFIALCDTLKSKGITPLGLTVTDFWPGFIWFEDLAIGMHPEFYEKLVIGQAKYTDPEAVEIMELWKSMIDKGYFSQPLDFNNEVAPAMMNGEFAMYLKGTWYTTFFEAVGMKAGEDYSAFILPSVNPANGYTVISEVTPFLVSEHSNNKDNAIKALAALTKKEAHEKWLTLYGGLPIRKDVAPSHPVTKKLAEEVSGKGYKLYTRFWEATPAELSEYASNEFVRFILNPESYMEVLNNIEDKAARYWAENK
jgi:multiple sugar transport system substrate-binding protein